VQEGIEAMRKLLEAQAENQQLLDEQLQQKTEEVRQALFSRRSIIIPPVFSARRPTVIVDRHSRRSLNPELQPSQAPH
jgi:hypothetical protein